MMKEELDTANETIAMLMRQLQQMVVAEDRPTAAGKPCFYCV